MARPLLRPLPLGRVRLASTEDISQVLDLINESMAKNFRIDNAADISYIMQNSILSICQLDTSDTVVGFISARDHPMIPALSSQAWEEYIWTKYKAIDMTARNTLFICLLCWNPAYSRDLVDNLLKSMFMHDPYLHYVAMIKTLPAYPLLMPGQSRAEGSFRRLQVMEKGIPGDMLPALCLAERSEVSPRLRVRRAVEEDNDDIVPIIERHTPRLREMYGEFYVSELISRHPESDRVLLVCEHKEVAVGVMCLNTQINYAALEDNFELSPYRGLRHLNTSSIPIKQNITSMADLSNVHATIESSMHFTPQQGRPKGKEKKPKVSWLYQEDCFREPEVPTPPSIPSSLMSYLPQLDILHLLEDEEEELEFDIVNINADLMKVPMMLSYESIGGLAENIMKVLDDKTKHVEMEDKSQKKKKHKFERVVEPVHYTGTPNAFLLELFAMHADYDERYGFDMLEAAYELFPDRDYCVMCLPTNHPTFPLLEHFTLVTPYCIRKNFIDKSLYVAHINSVKGEVSVRLGEAADLKYLREILEHAPRVSSLIDLFKSTFKSRTLDSYTLLSQKQPVGMVILGPLQDGTAIRMQYAVDPDPRWPGADATVLAGVLSPALEPHGRWYIRDVLRQSCYTTLFWICRLFAKGDMSPSQNMMSLSSHMVPVLPRRSAPNISGNKELDQIFQDVSTPFALWMLEKPITSMPKVLVNNSIVVVGASRTGLAFLESLIMGPAAQYLTFTNITLVSEHGLPTATDCLQAASTCVPREGRYTDRYLRSIPFYYYVDVMSAVMVQIDRKAKCIHLKGGSVKNYDELVLACGHQFQPPNYLHEAIERAKEVDKSKPCERILMDDPRYQPDRVQTCRNMPENLMMINSLAEANSCLKRLLRMISEENEGQFTKDECILVYGDCVEAYNCLAALLELGLSPKKLVFIEPFPPEDISAMRVNCFNNEIVDERVQESIKELGIRVIRQYSFTGWKQVDDRIVAIHLMSSLHVMRLPCFAFFYYGIKAIDINAFRAINECGLVYDGGLVVGPQFETNDPDIYGAGPCIKYSHRYYADQRQHSYYCSEDVGEELAAIFLRNFNPFVMAKSDVKDKIEFLNSNYSSSLLSFIGNHMPNRNTNKNTIGSWNRWRPVMRFESPIIQYSVLPGPLYYMKVRSPGPEIPMEVQLCLPHQGHTLVTDKGGNYFRLQLNSLHCVKFITCLTKEQFSQELISQLYGKHEAFFDKLLARYQMGHIEDLYEFFTQPWLAALYQETFEDLIRDINEQDVGTIYNLMRSHFYLSDKSLGSSTKEHTHKDVRNLGTFRSVIDKFVARTASSQVTNQPTDIPTECGQSSMLRKEASTFWKAVGGEDIVYAHVGRYLARNSFTNPHYARFQYDN